MPRQEGDKKKARLACVLCCVVLWCVVVVCCCLGRSHLLVVVVVDDGGSGSSSSSIVHTVQEMSRDRDGLACGLCSLAFDAIGLANGLEDGASGGCGVVGSSSNSGRMLQDRRRIGATHVDEGEGGEIARVGLGGCVDEDETDERTT